ncbi:AAA family ATPase [Streptomyces sp. MZ04]|uniref:AAA family ATPase n=1 Tax=Streptomyces sp. MZ04 TaxID=2559236 RepID=UPI0032AEB565
MTALIGREKAVARVRQLLGVNRLVTLTGPGGVGKTRLALEAAAGLADDFAEGVWLAELAGTRNGVAETVAAALGVRDDASVIRDEEPGSAGGASGAGNPAPDPLAMVLARALAPRRLLLVLDNCEHVLDEVAALLDQLLRHAPGLCVLATSQEPLALSGETLEAVAPLGEDEALELFAARAAATAPGFVLSAENSADAALICRRLDGIPLAIELAATRVRALGVHALAERLHDRFRLLNQARRDAPARQRTLRAMIDWSWELLTPDEQIVLRQLSVFSGGFTLESAEAVVRGGAPRNPGAAPGPGDTTEALDILDLVTRLVDRSLLTTAPGTDGAHPGIRYRMLESVTAYSLERLDDAGETNDARRRHAHHYTHLAEQAASQLLGPAQHHWLHRLDTETVNLRAALEWAATNDASLTPGGATASNSAATGGTSLTGPAGYDDAHSEAAVRGGALSGAVLSGDPVGATSAASGSAPNGSAPNGGAPNGGAPNGGAPNGGALIEPSVRHAPHRPEPGTNATPLSLRLANSLTWYWFLRGRLGEAERSLGAALDPHPAALDPHPAALDLRPAALDLRPAVLDLRPAVLDLRPAALDPHPAALDPHPAALDPHPNGDAAASARTARTASARTARAAFALLTGDAPRDVAAGEGADGADTRSRWLLAYARCGFRTPHEDARLDGILEEFRAADDRWGVAAALSVRATLALYRGDLPALRRDAEDSAARFAELGDRWGQLQASEQLGVLAEIAADYEAATRLHRDGMRDAEELRLWTDVSFRLSRLGRIALLTGDDAAATEFHARASRLAEQHSHRPAQQFAETGLAIGARRRGDLDTAEKHLLPWLAWNRRLGVDSGAALILAQLGYVAEQRGNAQRAEELHREGLTLARATGDDRAVALALEGLAGARSLAGDHTRTAELLGAAAALREAVGSPLPPAERADTERAAHRSRTALGEDDYAAAFAAAFASGHASPPEYR